MKSITKTRWKSAALGIGYNKNGICRYREYKRKEMSVACVFSRVTWWLWESKRTQFYRISVWSTRWKFDSTTPDWYQTYEGIYQIYKHSFIFSSQKLLGNEITIFLNSKVAVWYTIFDFIVTRIYMCRQFMRYCVLVWVLLRLFVELKLLLRKFFWLDIISIITRILLLGCGGNYKITSCYFIVGTDTNN